MNFFTKFDQKTFFCEIFANIGSITGYNRLEPVWTGFYWIFSNYETLRDMQFQIYILTYITNESFFQEISELCDDRGHATLMQGWNGFYWIFSNHEILRDNATPIYILTYITNESFFQEISELCDDRGHATLMQGWKWLTQCRHQGSPGFKR